VLISQNGRAHLSDHAFIVAATPGVVGVSRWRAHQFTMQERVRQQAGTEQAGIFTFTVSPIEAFTGELPFGDVKHRTAVLPIVRGQRSERPRSAESRGLTTRSLSRDTGTRTPANTQTSVLWSLRGGVPIPRRGHGPGLPGEALVMAVQALHSEIY